MSAPDEVPPIGPARVAYAEQTHRMALDLWDSVFPPWRWPRWIRQNREINRRLRLLRAANEQTRREHGIAP